MYGRWRVHTVTWLDREVQVEGVEAGDYPASRALYLVACDCRTSGRSGIAVPARPPRVRGRVVAAGMMANFTGASS